jgi:hypothetical protein
MQIHNHAYNLVGIYLEKTGYKHKWYKFYFTQEQRTDNDLVLKYCILHKTVVSIKKVVLKNPQVVEFMDFAPSRISVHFIPYRNINSGQSR